MQTNALSRSQRGNTKFLFIAIALIAILIGFYTQTTTNKAKELPEFSKTIILPNAKGVTYPNFDDHLGNKVNKELFLGKWSILFFGFTNCPDICPTTMQTLKQVKQNLEQHSAWDNYQAIMMTVDPETDTSERLNNYVTFFDSEFIGLTTDLQTTTSFAKQLGILFIKREKEGANTYEVDHSASMILINPQGQWAGVISAPHKADLISDDLKKLAEYHGPIKPVASKKTVTPTNAVSDNKKASDNSDASPLTITKAWVRPAPPTATAMAAYFNIKNNTDQEINIVDSHSSAFDMTMIHNTVIEDGIAKMVHMDGLTIPAKSEVSLAPLGTHMMLMRPENPLKEGDTINVTLLDENDQEYQYQISVRQQPN